MKLAYNFFPKQFNTPCIGTLMKKDFRSRERVVVGRKNYISVSSQNHKSF